MNIKITADSTCDLPLALVREHDITITPLGVAKGDGHFKDGVDITPADIFRHVAEGGELCSTTAVNVGEYTALFRELSPAYDAVIHVNIGSGFSCCHQNACIAAEEFDNVFAIDSRNLSCGQGVVVMEAVRRAKTCTDVNALCGQLRELTQRVESSFILNQLDYLAKGGRCSSVVALGANLLRLKPCIEVVDNKMTVGKKYRGGFAKCVAQYIRDRLEGRDDIDWDTPLYTPSVELDQEELDTARAAIAQFGKFRRVEEARAGCTICCHCGPHTVGLMFLRK